jgi:hypothetical protein
MNTTQSTVNFNNQTITRSEKMENQSVENRITGEVIDAYAKELSSGLTLGYGKKEAKDLAMSFIKNKFGIDNNLPIKDWGLLGSAAAIVYKNFSMPTMKKCRICGETKPISMFSKRNTSPDKHQSQCKACDHNYQQEYKKRKRMTKQQKPEQVDLTKLFKYQEVIVEDISMTFTRNNMQVRYTNSEFLYSPIEGCQFNDADVEDLLVLRSLAKSKVEKFNGAN